MHRVLLKASQFIVRTLDKKCMMIKRGIKSVNMPGGSIALDPLSLLQTLCDHDQCIGGLR